MPGLDTTFIRIENAQVLWFSAIELPESVLTIQVMGVIELVTLGKTVISTQTFTLTCESYCIAYGVQISAMDSQMY